MQKLRNIHLYLGCMFAPMLLFFAVSGLWQSFGLQYYKGDESRTLALATTIHTGRGLKANEPSTLSSPGLHWFVVAMAVGFILTTVLGVVMALRFGKSRRAAIACLLVGLLLPLGLVLLKLFT
jgi:hypothetical protein